MREHIVLEVSRYEVLVLDIRVEMVQSLQLHIRVI